MLAVVTGNWCSPTRDPVMTDKGTACTVSSFNYRVPLNTLLTRNRATIPGKSINTLGLK